MNKNKNKNNNNKNNKSNNNNNSNNSNNSYNNNKHNDINDNGNHGKTTITNKSNKYAAKEGAAETDIAKVKIIQNEELKRTIMASAHENMQTYMEDGEHRLLIVGLACQGCGLCGNRSNSAQSTTPVRDSHHKNNV